MSSTAFFEDTVNQTQGAVERAAEVWRQGAEALSNQTNLLSHIPGIDPVAHVERYFEWVQAQTDINRTFAIQWAQAVATLFGAVREQAEHIGRVGVEQADKLADATTEQSRKAASTAKDTARQTRQAARDEK